MCDHYAMNVQTLCRRIVWCKHGTATAATFQSISMHALSRDSEFYKKACIYCQLDEPEELAAASDEDVVCSHEIMLVPEDESAGVHDRESP